MKGCLSSYGRSASDVRPPTLSKPSESIQGLKVDKGLCLESCSPPCSFFISSLNVCLCTLEMTISLACVCGFVVFLSEALDLFLAIVMSFAIPRTRCFHEENLSNQWGLSGLRLAFVANTLTSGRISASWSGFMSSNLFVSAVGGNCAFA